MLSANDAVKKKRKENQKNIELSEVCRSSALEIVFREGGFGSEAIII
jgi:hypothetical protein